MNRCTGTMLVLLCIVLLYASLSSSPAYALLPDFSIPKLSRQQTSITLAATPRSITVGDQVTFSGTLMDHSGTGLSNKVILVKQNNCNLCIPITGITDSSGSFSMKWTPDMTGTFSFHADFFSYDPRYHNSSSNDVTVQVNPEPSSVSPTQPQPPPPPLPSPPPSLPSLQPIKTHINIQPSSYTVTEGQQVTFSGVLTDADGNGMPNQQVYVKRDIAFAPDSVLGSPYTDSNGGFSFTWTATKPVTGNTANIYATFEGSSQYSSSRSSDISIQVMTYQSPATQPSPPSTPRQPVPPSYTPPATLPPTTYQPVQPAPSISEKVSSLKSRLPMSISGGPYKNNQWGVSVDLPSKWSGIENKTDWYLDVTVFPGSTINKDVLSASLDQFKSMKVQGISLTVIDKSKEPQHIQSVDRLVSFALRLGCPITRSTNENIGGIDFTVTEKVCALPTSTKDVTPLILKQYTFHTDTKKYDFWFVSNNLSPIDVYTSLSEFDRAAETLDIDGNSKSTSQQPSHQEILQLAQQYIPTLTFSHHELADGKAEHYFPVKMNFDGDNNTENNKENYQEYTIDQKQEPAVYVNVAQRNSIYYIEYWYYYVYNLFPKDDHYHDWEWAMVVLDGNHHPIRAMTSFHITHMEIPWNDVISDNGHPLFGIEGGSHAVDPLKKDGVEIRYDGTVTENDGYLQGAPTCGWNIFCYLSGSPPSETYQWNVTDGNNYKSDHNFQHFHYQHNSRVDIRPAPWLRPEWSAPWLLNATTYDKSFVKQDLSEFVKDVAKLQR